MAPVRSIFRSLNPNSSPIEFGQFGRFPAQEQVLGRLLAVLLEYLGLLLADEVIPLRLQWLAFRQILRVRFRIGGNAEEGQFVRLDGTGEDTVEGVIIARGNRIVLVVVAASAAHGQRHRPPRNRINAVVDRVVDVVLELPANGQEPKTGQRLFVLAKVELIRGKLLEQGIHRKADRH